jgi:YD repeat-containing protein
MTQEVTEMRVKEWQNSEVGQPKFRLLSASKWGLALLLLASAAVLLVRKPAASPVKVELLPFTDSPPTWNGAYPYLIVSPVDLESNHVKFKSSVLLMKPTVRHDSPINEFQVDLHSGMFVLRQTDLFVADLMSLSLTRTYRGWDFDNRARAFGLATNHPYDICPTMTRFPYTDMNLNLDDARQIHFSRISKGTSYADAVFRHDETSSEFYGAQYAWNGDGWTLNFRDGRRFLFPEAYNAKTFAQGAPYEMSDADGHRVHLKRDKQRKLEQLISPSGHTITFRYDGADRIIEATDDAGNIRKYSYDSTDHLQSVADESHLLYRFEYAPLLHLAGYDPYLMTAVVDGRGEVLLQNIYKDSDGGRISEQRLENGGVYRYEYIFVKNDIVETILTDPIVGRRKFFFRRGVFTREE